MKVIDKLLIKKTKEYLSSYFNTNMLRSVILFSGGIILFVAGVIVYGIIINMREVPLSVDMSQKGFTKLDDPVIVVSRSSYSLKLYNDTVLIKSYTANFGRNVSVPKSKAGDLATPVGDYKICEIDTNTKYYKFFKINYPNIYDATEALRKGVITQQEFDKIKYDYYYGICPDPNTELGGNMGIHGIGRLDFLFKYLPFVYNWTDGSIAISNENMDELYSVVKKGTKVVIK
ncbi:MAG TPA: L,D-transpeptidase [Ignavibacteriaceae bacterium]|nr:L,D-transpeptidase [Ignavibacteriaceae bacterium]